MSPRSYRVSSTPVARPVRRNRLSRRALMARTLRALLIGTFLIAGCVDKAPRRPAPDDGFEPVTYEAWRDTWDEWVSGTGPVCGGGTAVAADLPGGSSGSGARIEVE